MKAELATSSREFIEYLVKQIVTKPDEVLADEEKINDFTNIKLKVSTEDMGLVIGKEGKTIRAVRSLVRAKAIKTGIRVNLELIDSKLQNDQI